MTLPANEVRSKTIGVRLSAEEVEDLESAAGAIGLRMSAFIRMLILSSIKRDRSAK